MPASVFAFGDFQLDCGAFELLRNGKSLRVERKPMELLILLASRQGQLVTRGEIAERLWSSEVFVDTEHGINTAIRKLRQVLGDDPDDPKFIQTVTGMGYRFVAEVSSVMSPSMVQPIRPADESTVSVPNSASAVKRGTWGWYVGAGVCALLAFGGSGLYRLRHHAPEITYTQLTDFTDSAGKPALSPDGRMLAFFRGGASFMTSDQIYVKLLPNGEARRVTDDKRSKYGLAFSPDGSEIAYTVMDGSFFSTYEVSSLGGEPQLLLHNAAGLVWLDPQRLLFSEAPTGIHLSVVTSSITRGDKREIYSPAHERGMAHYTFPSPDRRWGIVVEMTGTGAWGPCRLVALEGQGQSRILGPAGACTSAGWSPDGRWMYFTATVRGQSHIWRQRFPEGEPEQITFGPTEEDGIAVEPEGHALITSVGVHESSIWIHDASGERSLSSEGEVVWWPSPVFTPDASVIYYLLKRRGSSGAELWRTVVDSDKSEAVFPGIPMTAFDLSPDGKRVVYTTQTSNGTTALWLARLDQTSPPTKLNISEAREPRFGAHGQILFTHAEGSNNYLEQIDPDGTHLSKLIPYAITDLQGVSPGRRWATVGVPETPQGSSSAITEGNSPSVILVPLDGGAARRVCVTYCQPNWSTNGKFLYVPVEDPTRSSPGRSLAIPVGPGETLPDFPAGGIAPMAEPSVIRGAQSVGRARLVPGTDPGDYAWVNTTVHRNLYRISLP